MHSGRTAAGKKYYQWGHQRRYTGPNAHARALHQMGAIFNAGWRGRR